MHVDLKNIKGSLEDMNNLFDDAERFSVRNYKPNEKNPSNFDITIRCGDELAKIIKTKKSLKSLIKISKNVKVVVKKSYKIWVVIEEQTEFSDGSEELKDLEDNTQSCGYFDTLEEAERALAEINANYEGDFRK